jgi:hypothetical protein
MCKLTHHAFDAVTIVHHVMAHGGFKHGVHAPGGAPLGARGHHRLAACRPDFHGSMSEITLWTIAAFSTFHEIFAKAAFVTTFLGPPRTHHTCHHAKGTWARVETRRLHGTNLTLRVGIDTIFPVLAFGQTFTHNGFKERIFLDFHLDSHHPVRVGFFPQFILTMSVMTHIVILTHSFIFIIVTNFGSVTRQTFGFLSQLFLDFFRKL